MGRPGHGTLSGNIFSDGSSVDPASARAGWSLIQLNDSNQLVAAVFGHVPWEAGPEQTARDAEDYAIAMDSLFVVEPATIHADCSGTVAVGK